jgi:hypothetical protein
MFDQLHGSTTGTIIVTAPYPGDSLHVANTGSTTITVNAQAATTTRCQ